MLNKHVKQHNYYFPDKLKKQLALIPYYSVTIIEAPSGFGKTTAVREFLKEHNSDYTNDYWYTCFGESNYMTWMGICDLFSNISTELATKLKNLMIPDINTLFYVKTYLKNINCSSQTYLIIDNYQIMTSDISYELLNVFSMHECKNLHMIFITQHLDINHKQLIYNSNIHTIDVSSFFFSREDTAKLLRLEGIRFTDTELENIFMSTEGWVSALRLLMINYWETGFFDFNADIEKLVESAIWNRLSQEEKDFLLSVSILDKFNERQAAIIMEKEILPENIENFIKQNNFIRYLPEKHVYRIHSVLKDYLQTRFHYNIPDKLQTKIFRNAGHACAAISEYYSAVKFFYKIKDYDAILELPFSCEYFDDNMDNYEPELFEQMIRECPKETLKKYPYNIIIFGYLAYTHGQYELYHTLCEQLDFLLNNELVPEEEQYRKISGEFILLKSMENFNDIIKLRESQEKAFELLGRPSEIIKSSTLWEHTTPSVLNMVWREPGKLDNIIKEMDRSVFTYRKITGDQSVFVQSLLKAEVLLMRGEDEEAEILCYKAVYNAQSSHYTSICLTADLILARIAILRGDAVEYKKVLKRIQNLSQNNDKIHELRMVEHSMSVLGLVLEIKEYYPPWMSDLGRIKEVLHTPVVPHAQILHLKLLLLEKRFKELFGATQMLLDLHKDLSGNVRYVMPQLYCLKYLSVAYYNMGDIIKAQEYLNQALSLALPDKIYLPIAQQMDVLRPLIESAKYSLQDREAIEALIALGERQSKGVENIKKAVFANKSPLTPREREVALLAKERLSSKEIANKLYISESTVRTILRSVYNKLDIHSKTDLISKEF